MTRIASQFRIAAALTLGLAGMAAAQTKPKTQPTKTVPITKEAPGEVVRVDTVTVHDTVTTTVYRRDTLTVTGPTITRYDTVNVMTIPGDLDYGHGVYFGLGAGPEYPSAGLGGGQIPGYLFRANLGWDAMNGPLGFRLTGELARPDEAQTTAAFTARPSIINTSADLKLRIPYFRSARFPGFGLYAVGGGVLSFYKDAVFEDENKNLVIPTDGSWHDQWGYDLGGGATVQLGHKREVFVEARYITTMKSGFENNHQVPIVLGINWY
jgi:hypothetical protein